MHGCPEDPKRTTHYSINLQPSIILSLRNDRAWRDPKVPGARLYSLDPRTREASMQFQPLSSTTLTPNLVRINYWLQHKPPNKNSEKQREFGLFCGSPRQRVEPKVDHSRAKTTEQKTCRDDDNLAKNQCVQKDKFVDKWVGIAAK